MKALASVSFLTCFLLNIASIDARSVTVDLQAKWKEVSPLHEAMRYMDRNGHLPAFFEALAAQVLDPERDEAEDIHTTAFAASVAQKVLKVEEHALYQRAMATRHFAPAIHGCADVCRVMLENIFRDVEHTEEYADGFVYVVSEEKAYILENEESLRKALENGTFDSDNLRCVPVLAKEAPTYHQAFQQCALCVSSVKSESHRPSDFSITLFGSLGTQKTARLLTCMQKLCLQHYTYSEIPEDFFTFPKNNTAMYLSGYDVNFIVKSTEYTAYDASNGARATPENTTEDIAALTGVDYLSRIEKSPHEAEAIRAEHQEAFRRFTTGCAIDPQSLTIDEDNVASMGQRASVAIIRSGNSLETLQKIASSLPLQLRDLQDIKMASKNSKRVTAAVERTQEQNRHLYSPGDTVLFLCQRKYDLADASIFSLTDAIFAEMAFQKDFQYVTALCLKLMEPASHLMWQKSVFDALVTKSVPPSQTPTPRVRISEQAVYWLNDLERDAMYARFPADPMQIFSAPFPIPVRKNLFQFVVVLDPSSRPHLLTLFRTLSAYRDLVAIRIGYAFSPWDADDAQAQATCAISQVHAVLTAMHPDDPAAGIVFLAKLAEVGTDDIVTLEDIDAVVGAMFGKTREVLLSDSDADISETIYEKLHDFRSKGYSSSSPTCFFNGQRVPCDESPQRAYLSELEALHPLIFNKKLTADTPDCQRTLLDAFGAVERFHAVHREDPTYLSAANCRRLAEKCDRLDWIVPSGPSTEGIALVSTVWCIDVSTAHGLETLINALEYVENFATSRDRCAFSFHASKPSPNVKILEAVFGLKDLKVVRDVVSVLLKEMKDKIVGNSPDFLREHLRSPLPDKTLISQLDFTTKATDCIFADFAANYSFAVLNGRVVHFSEYPQPIRASDMQILAARASSEMQEVIAAAAASSSEDLSITALSNAFMLAYALYQADVLVHAARIPSIPSATNDSLDGFAVQAESGAAPLLSFGSTPLCAVVDPLSLRAAKAIALLEIVHTAIGGDACVLLNHVQQLTERPIFHFSTHYVQPLSLDSSHAGVQRLDLPENVLLSVTVQPPPSWVVFAQKASIDPDNVYLATAASLRVSLSYALESFVLEGQCVHVEEALAPQGVLLGLRGIESQRASETLVMASSGYFQLKHSLGLHTLPLGENTKEYEIVKVLDGPQSFEVKVDEKGEKVFPLLFQSFSGAPLTVKVAESIRNESKPAELAETLPLKSPQSFLQKISHFFFPPARPQQTVHVFSIASGHLYERFLRLMMFRVTQTTRAHVKFWFIDDFLSPRFRALLPHFAREFRCSYELVSYKWPRWLRRQTTKQRHIWAYKVLFLDVLFPPDVSRVVFVDADQIVQSDIANLYNTDLRGRAVGFVPLCVGNSRNETRPYRFWDAGHWKEHLQGKPYHISAIFVVDLDEFRRVGAGDVYRSAYQSLTADPKNLANLDQDLPNYLQDVVPIHSLPQEWLWCEAWCDDASLRRAKTIDLCNNPLTKEPKIDVAERVIPNWRKWDAALTEFENAQLKDGEGKGKGGDEL